MKDDEYIWVVGDVHGMYEQLELILKYIRKKPIYKIIFLGDYIDRGPGSKQVLDLLMNLEEDHVYLLGNHEKMMIDYIESQKKKTEYAYTWNWNGGDDTIKSFGFKEYSEFVYGLETKYIDFITNLKITHTENIEKDDLKFQFIFSHAGLSESIPLVDQLSFKNFKDMDEYFLTSKFDDQCSPIWVRDEFLFAQPDFWKDYIVVHGHTPTMNLDHYYRRLPSFKESELPEIYSTQFCRDLPFLRKHPDKNKIASIDVDTGAAYDNRLSAIGLSKKNLQMSSKSMIVETIQTSKIFPDYRPYIYKKFEIM